MSEHRQKATIDGHDEHAAPVGHVVDGPCPHCCAHQLPYALGCVIATFEIVDGAVKESA